MLLLRWGMLLLASASTPASSCSGLYPASASRCASGDPPVHVEDTTRTIAGGFLSGLLVVFARLLLLLLTAGGFGFGVALSLMPMLPHLAAHPTLRGGS